MKYSETMFVLDTNVLLDYYVPNRPKSGDAKAFFDFALTHKAFCSLLYSPHCLSNVFYLLTSMAKRKIRSERGSLSQEEANAAAEFAWGCVNHLQNNATAVGADQSDVWLACKLRSIHNDLEDNLIIAAATRAHASYLITNDEKLVKHATVPALTPKDALAMLQAFD